MMMVMMAIDGEGDVGVDVAAAVAFFITMIMLMGIPYQV